MPDLIITDALVERCAQAADDARSDRYGLARRPLADMHPENRSNALAMARACLTEALHPAHDLLWFRRNLGLCEAGGGHWCDSWYGYCDAECGCPCVKAES